MTLPAAFFGTFNFLALSGLSKMTSSVVKASPSTQAIFRSWQHNRRKEFIVEAVGTQDAFSEDSMFYDRITKPSELDSVNLNLSEDGKVTSPLVKILSYINSDPRNFQSRQELANKFEEFRVIYFFEEAQLDTVQTVDKRPETSDLSIVIAIGDPYEGLFPEFNKDMINYIHSKLFDPEYDQNKPEGVMDQIIYRSERVLEAREFLKSTTYQGLWILKDGIINPKIYEILGDKFNKGEEFSKLERIISDIMSFYMGSMHNGESMPDGGYDSRLIKLYEETTGERAIINNVPTETFKDWYNTKQANINRKDMRSPNARQIIQSKKDRLKQTIIEQLQHYSLTGERLTSQKEVIANSELSYSSVNKYAKAILRQIFNDPESASLIYEMIFGHITTSYQEKREECIDNGLIIKTTPTQWFDMLKNRGDKTPSQLYIEVQCTSPEKHVGSILMSQILPCRVCHINSLSKPIDLQRVLEVAREHNLQAVSFRDDSQELTENEFNELVKAYNDQHQDSNDYKSKTIAHLNLRWRCLECDHIFERSYTTILRYKVKKYCPRCVSSIDQQITLEKTEAAFQGHITQSFRSNEQLYKFLPERVLLMDKYQVISDPRCHVDAYGFVSVAGKEFKIAIESQGPQHYSFVAYLDLAKAQDLKRGVYKTDEQCLEDFKAQVERDRVKVELFKDLNKDGYFLIIVPYWKPPSERRDFILREFIRQTKINPNDVHISDFFK